MLPAHVRRAGSDSEGGSDDGTGGSFEDTDGEDALSDGGPRMLVEPPSAPLGAQVWDSRDEGWSADLRFLYGQAWDGLNKPSWLVYPSSMRKLALATAQLLQHGAPLKPEPEQFMREVLPATFAHCFEDGAVYRWAEHLQVDVLDAACALTHLLRVRLDVLGGAPADADEEDLVPLLSALAPAFDPTSPFHLKHRLDPLPTRNVKAELDESFAAPQPLVDDALVENSSGQFEASSRVPAHRWLTHIVNTFGHSGCFAALLQLLDNPRRASLRTLEACLKPLAKVAPLLDARHRGSCESAVMKVLEYAMKMLEQPELLAKARDKNLAALSSLVRNAQTLLAAITAPDRAARTVVIVQRGLVLAMLSASTFSLQLAGVREINAMLDAAQPPPPRPMVGPMLSGLDAPSVVQEADDAGMEENARGAVTWLETEGVLSRMLRSHLHLKQYVEQVERIMRFLLRRGCLHDQHLDLVWSITEKQDTFEETKANMFALLAALAVDFSASQLDKLFARFEQGRDRSAADTVKIMGLITALARGDASGVLAVRLTDLLWSQLLLPEAPPEALQTLVEVVNNYASAAPACRATIISRCLDNVGSGVCVLPSVRLLRHLLVTHPVAMTDGETQQSILDRQREEIAHLNETRGVVSLLLGELENYMAAARSAVAAGSAAPPGDGRASHSECLTERLSFLSGLLLSGISLGVPEVDRLWACMTTGAAHPGDADVLANWLKKIPQAAFHGRDVLTADAARHVLSMVGAVPPAHLTTAWWACMSAFVAMVGISAGHMLRTPASSFNDALPPYNPVTAKAAALNVPLTTTLEFEGLTRIWDAALEAPSPVCESAIQWLAWLYPQLLGSTPADTMSLRQALLSQAEAFLNAAHAKLLASPADSTAAAAKRVENVLRMLDIVITNIDTAHHAARHAARAAPPVHGATYGGRQVSIDYQVSNKAASSKHTLMARGNQYAGSLRLDIAAIVGIPADRLRLLWAGKELSSTDCSQLPCSKIEGATINIVVVQHPAVGPLPPPPIAAVVDSDPDTPSMETEATVPRLSLGAVPDVMQSARQLLAVMPGLYDTLYSLADAGHPALCAHATTILNALPTRAETRSHLESLLPAGISGPDLAAAAADSRRQLALALSAPPAKRAYTLQILEGLMIPVNGFVSPAAAAAAVTAFRALGGPGLVLAALMPSTLPANIGAVPLRGLFLSGLNLLHLLTTDSDAASLVRDLDADVDSAADRFAADTVDVLLWLLPRTAMGRLGSSDGDSIVTTDASGDAYMASDVSSALYALADGEQQALDPNDAYLTRTGLELLARALGQRSGGVMRLLGRPDATNVLTDLLLRCSSSVLRDAAARTCFELVLRENSLLSAASPSRAATSGCVAAMSGSGGSGAAFAGAAPLSGSEDATAAVAATRRAMLNVLLSLRPIADESPATCGKYFDLVSGLLAASADSGLDGAQLDELLAQEVRWLTQAEPCTDSADCRLEGHLSLVLSLVRGLRRRSVVTPAGCTLLSLLLHVFLFPELRFLEHTQAGGDMDDEALELTAKASTPGTRTQAFNLVIALATHDAAALGEVRGALHKLHFDTSDKSLTVGFTKPASHWDRSPQYTSRRTDGFVGLGNGGATCYMNSVFQQLFMQPSIRRNVLSAVDATDAQPADSVLCQLQATFGALHASQLDHHRPEAFWNAFKDYDGQPVNVREHQDALEFLTRLQEQVDAAVKKPAPPGFPPPAPGAPGPTLPLEQVLGGMLVNTIQCRACAEHRSEKDESFTSLPVDIRNKSGLVEALASYVQGELLEGDNQWVCEACGRKVDAVKRQTVKTLPQMLCIQLKRFEYDYETMQRLKVKDRFEFPTELDMRPFTREGVSEEAVSPSEAAQAAPPDDKYAYTLMGVVVHSGSAFAGHYYSYIRERVLSADGTLAAGSWHVFDDKRVEPYDAANLERDTFGGKYSTEGWDQTRKLNTQMEFDRPNSAYMLFYERLGAPAEPAGDVAMDGSAAPAQLAVRLPPRVAQEVRAANAQCVHESHLLSRDYFAFVRGLVDANVEYSRKRRRDAPAALQAADLAGAEPSADVLCCQLAANFLLRVYSHAGPMLRDYSTPVWINSMTNLLESSPAACRWFLQWLTNVPNKENLRKVMCRLAGEDVRELWWRLCLSALRTAGLHDAEVVAYDALFEQAEDDEEDDDLLEPPADDPDLPSLVHKLVAQVLEYVDPSPLGRGVRGSKDQHVETVLLLLHNYAKLGPVQRAHLMLCEAQTTMTEFAVNKLDSYSPRMENTGTLGFAVHTTLAHVLRGVGGSHFPQKHSGPPNPYALPGATGTCPLMTDLVREWSKYYRDKYIPLMVDVCMVNDEVISLACYLSWWQNSETRIIMVSMLEEFHNVRIDDHGCLGGLLRLAEGLLGLNDNLQQWRLDIFLHGEKVTHRTGGVAHSEAPFTGLLDILGSPNTPIFKRATLLKWLVEQHDGDRDCPTILQPLPQVCAPVLLDAVNLCQEECERQQRLQTVGFTTDPPFPAWLARARDIATELMPADDY